MQTDCQHDAFTLSRSVHNSSAMHLCTIGDNSDSCVLVIFLYKRKVTESLCQFAVKSLCSNYITICRSVRSMRFWLDSDYKAWSSVCVNFSVCRWQQMYHCLNIIKVVQVIANWPCSIANQLCVFVILTLQTCFSVLVKSFWAFSDRIVELSQERQGEREERHKATGPGLI